MSNIKKFNDFKLNENIDDTIKNDSEIKKHFFKVEVQKALKDFENAYNKLVGLWYDDSKYDIDLNEYSDSKEYPFERSLDDYYMGDWVQDFIEKLKTK